MGRSGRAAPRRRAFDVVGVGQCSLDHVAVLDALAAARAARSRSRVLPRGSRAARSRPRCSPARGSGSRGAFVERGRRRRACGARARRRCARRASTCSRVLEIAGRADASRADRGRRAERRAHRALAPRSAPRDAARAALAAPTSSAGARCTSTPAIPRLAAGRRRVARARGVAGLARRRHGRARGRGGARARSTSRSSRAQFAERALRPRRRRGARAASRRSARAGPVVTLGDARRGRRVGRRRASRARPSTSSVRDTTGAGDVFHGAFVVARARGRRRGRGRFASRTRRRR